MFISLYTTRVVLNALGASDFGIFNVVGGTIAILGFLNAAMSSSTQRFMSYYEGIGDRNRQKQIFAVSSILHSGIAVALMFLLIVVGYFFFNGILNIPSERIVAARVIYFALIFSTVFSVLSVPYEAVLNAHENMLFYSIVGILESILKLIVALVIVSYASDKLILYGVLMAAIPFVVRIVMQVYCHKEYVECVFPPWKYWDPLLAREIGGFAGWSFFGAAAGITSNYGQGILLNVFFGPLLNAAQGIALQLSGQVAVFSNNMIKALSPIIVKSEGSGDRDMVIRTLYLGSKFSFFLLAAFSIPLILEMTFVFKVWLVEFPSYAVLFARLRLVNELLTQLLIPLNVGISAVGKIRKFQVVNSLLLLAGTVFSCVGLFIFKLPYLIHLFVLGFNTLWFFLVTAYFSRKYLGINFVDFNRFVLCPIIEVSSISILFAVVPLMLMDEGFVRLFLVVGSFGISFVLTTYRFALSKEEKKILISLPIVARTIARIRWA